MTPTRPALLVGLAVLFAVLGYLIGAFAYGSVPQLPAGAPITLLLLAVVEGALAKLVRDRILRRPTRAGTPPRRPLHPVQIARLAALAKASSPAAAMLFGGYFGLFVWTFRQARVLEAARDDVVVAGLSALAALALVLAALALERACRVPRRPEEDDDESLGSIA